jgi:hypothetical protein
MFVVGALNEEMVRMDPTFRDKVTIRNGMLGTFVSLRFYQKRTSLRVSALCQITHTDCPVAIRLESYWGQQPLAPELQSLLD